MAMKKSMKRSATPKATTPKKAAPSKMKAAPAPKMKKKSAGGEEMSKEVAVNKLTKTFGKTGIYVSAVLVVIVAVLAWFSVVLEPKIIANYMPQPIGETYLTVATSTKGALHSVAHSTNEGITAVMGKLGALVDSVGGSAMPASKPAATKPAAAAKPAAQQAPPAGGAPPQK